MRPCADNSYLYKCSTLLPEVARGMELADRDGILFGRLTPGMSRAFNERINKRREATGYTATPPALSSTI